MVSKVSIKNELIKFTNIMATLLLNIIKIKLIYLS